MKNKGRNLLIAAIITLGFAGLILLLFHPSNSPLGSFFDVLIVMIVTHYLTISFGVAMLLLRLLKVVKDNGILIYAIAGALNFFLAMVGITLYFLDEANMEWLHKSIGNLLVGFLILADILCFPAPVRK